MGDVLTLIEQAEQAFDQSQAEEMAAKIAGDDFTLEDFLDQMLQMKKMGPIANLLGMLPGMGQMKEQLAQVDDRDVDRVMAIIRGMTPQERQQPKILNASRKARVARGTGVTVSEVNKLLDRFEEARKMMKQMAGMAGIGGVRKARRQVKKGKGASRKGNPAARAAAAQAPPTAASTEKRAGQNPFGLPADGQVPDLSKLQLPPGGFNLPKPPQGPQPRRPPRG
jgi:signal recognition particle subunit SRP54